MSNTEMWELKENERLTYHLKEVLAGHRRFENAFQGIIRMILEKPIEKIVHAGRTTYDFAFFRQGSRHIIGLYDEINDFVNFVKDAAEGGSSKEMAFVLVGEPGNGKTFFIEFVCKQYRRFISRPENRKYTFEFLNMGRLGGFGNIPTVESQTFEDPLILAMNIFEDPHQGREFLNKQGFSEKQTDLLFASYRPLGACTEYIWKKFKEYHDNNVETMLESVRVVPVSMAESLGILTGKYSAKDKITSSSVDLLGEESISRLLQISDPGNPFKFDLRRGALARVAGGGIHFADEKFRNKKDLVQVYLGVTQNRTIEIDGYKWPIDTLIVGTSNNEVFNQFKADPEEAPIVDRCRICYVSHNTDYRLQEALTLYASGDVVKSTIRGNTLHLDPNLIYAASVGVVLSRLLKSEKLTPTETMKLAAGEIAGEKGIKTLAEVVDASNQNPDITKRWGQKGLGQRDLGRALQILMSLTETNEGECMFAYDIFRALERIVLDYVQEATDRSKYLEDLRIAKQLYREQIKTAMFNAYMDDSEAIHKDVMNYVNMIIGIDAENLGPIKIWTYKDPQTGERRSVKIDEKYINSVEDRMGHKNREQKEAFRNTVRKIYGQKITVEPNYDFMDNQELVKAVTDVRLNSDVGSAGSLVGALTNRTNEENQRLYNRMVETMLGKLGYCRTCSQKTIEYFCEKKDEG